MTCPTNHCPSCDRDLTPAEWAALSEYTNTPPVVGERNRLIELLRSNGAEVDGLGYAFDGAADVSYTVNGRSYSLEVRDITPVLEDGAADWDGS
jgi:hypothetical protein